ncbi:MAG: deoxyguanosinetriphosphate triphosphohydrolase [Nitrospinae bacterium]|nr:deoxyguanosinetriphosphate triphosphohydrolase [Nitrospinota bacterium]
MRDPRPAETRDFEGGLAPYASRASSGRGRAHPEAEHQYRSAYQRDRDRIIHSQAFRRLESKTQVYTNLFQEGDLFRKRLTHTIEVAQISRTVARELCVNEDLAESIALAHDLGHAPFGHKGQDILDDLMRDAGGFEHNTQSLRIICLIEHRYPDFQGLNLTWEVREGVAKKGHRQAEPLKKEFEGFPNPSLEAQIVDVCDPITYTTHDLDDGITNGTIGQETLGECLFWNEGVGAVKSRHPDLRGKILNYQVIRHIINAQITDLIAQTRRNLEASKPSSPDDVRSNPDKTCSFSAEMKAKHDDLKRFLYRNMYEHHRVKRMEEKAREVIEKLFHKFLSSPELLPASVQAHFKREKAGGNEKRIVCDYVAGMTDRYALEEYDRLFNLRSRV